MVAVVLFKFIERLVCVLFEFLEVFDDFMVITLSFVSSSLSR